MSWGPADPGEIAPARDSQFLEIVDESHGNVPFTCKLTNPKPTNPTASSIELSYSGPIPPCPNHPKARYQTSRDSSYIPEPTEIIQSSQP